MKVTIVIMMQAAIRAKSIMVLSSVLEAFLPKKKIFFILSGKVSVSGLNNFADIKRQGAI
jgi:hypothetical protein